MKQTLKQLLSFGGVASVLAAALLFCSPAQAATWTQITNPPYTNVGGPGNPNCYKLATANLPTAATEYIFCGSTNPNSGSETSLNNAVSALTLIQTFPANTLKSNDYEIDYFQTFTDYCRVWLTDTYPGTKFNTDCQALFNEFPYFTEGATKPTGLGRQSFTNIFETGLTTYPNGTTYTNISHVALHEAGHAFDYALGQGSLYLSQANQSSTGTPIAYFGVLALDYYNNGQCVSSPASVWYDDTVYYSSYFHCPYLGELKQNDFTELFAEQFAMGASGSQYTNNPLFESAPPALDISAIYDGGTIHGTLCSNTWVWYYMLYGAPAPESWYQELGIEDECYGSSTAFNVGSGG